VRIAYEPHPVSPERKAELRAQGFKIIDARFKPLELVEAIGADVDALQAKDEAKAPPASTVDAKFDHNGDGKPGGSKPAAERGLDELKAEAIALGITIDRRWGERRLRAEIEKAQG
jgi:hypothetical protein